jgi:hypothetical protein
MKGMAGWADGSVVPDGAGQKRERPANAAP